VSERWLSLCYIGDMRKDLLAVGEVYHIFVKSIADYTVFNNEDEFSRMLKLITYYRFKNYLRFSDFLELKIVQKEGLNNAFNIVSKDKEKLVQVVAYCLMPTHIHLVLKQLNESGVSNFMRKVLDGYTRYFNTIHKRKGPLWESKFKNVLVDNDEQLIHLTRYIHLNPVTAFIVDKPEDWIRSSYKEYLKNSSKHPLCQFRDILEVKPSSYRKFVKDQISYQRELGKIKKLLLD